MRSSYLPTNLPRVSRMRGSGEGGTLVGRTLLSLPLTPDDGRRDRLVDQFAWAGKFFFFFLSPSVRSPYYQHLGGRSDAGARLGRADAVDRRVRGPWPPLAPRAKRAKRRRHRRNCQQTTTSRGTKTCALHLAGVFSYLHALVRL